MDLIVLVVEVVVGGSRIASFVCCLEAYPVAVQEDFHKMIVSAALEVVLKSRIAEAYSAY